MDDSTRSHELGAQAFTVCNRKPSVRASLILTALAISLSGCGYVGDPKPPALNIPLPVDDLALAQRGAKLRIAFTLPLKSIEGLPITEFSEVDLRIGPAAPGDFNADAWSASAKRVSVPLPLTAKVLQVEAPVTEFAGKEIVCAVRTAGPKGRMSAFSNIAVYRVLPPLGTPDQVKAVATAEGIQLTWIDPAPAAGVTYRIARQSDTEKELTAYAESTRPSFTDKRTEFGKKYRYQVLGVVKTGDHEVESEPSGILEIVPVDNFPPSMPVGLNALAGVTTIELSWDRNTDSDFRGYHVFRAIESGDFTKIGGPVESPTYSDRMIEPGKTYRYAVSAVDAAGNESPRTPPVQITAPQ